MEQNEAQRLGSVFGDMLLFFTFQPLKQNFVSSISKEPLRKKNLKLDLTKVSFIAEQNRLSLSSKYQKMLFETIIVSFLIKLLFIKGVVLVLSNNL